ncbi:coenzyme F420-0:L-glutamate ligase [Nocardioides sp. cx-169]|uniref:coenzyme F420-0:L-glutamate ligase n=1 Tax=Nocardioides sp. cx-169 TaxID=2899080 RepID=UPI001E3F397C|nr:coenzyme F420-0:L-glutamate ligase [Nocardioides sp. cx-169]MCD4534133.1 coenzyme F420-0:L-glutamate ligase [Nocardioides sp. cx-169]
MSGPTVSATAPDGLPEVREGDDLAAMVAGALPDLADGDVVVVTSKVVSKAEGRVVPGTREEALPGETARVVARRGPTTIVRTHHGLVLAAGGIDASNVERGSVVLLPLDPDASARALRAELRRLTGRNVAVVVTDTAGRAWREGQTDLAVGAAGLVVAEDFAGRIDAHGNELAVTAPAVADELAGLAELAQGKLGARPVAAVRGRADLVLPPEDNGPGAVALVRAEGADLFGFGAREAVVRAVTGDPADRVVFGTPAPAEELAAALHGLQARTTAYDGGLEITDEAPRQLVAVLAFAHGWVVEESSRHRRLRLRPATP